MIEYQQKQLMDLGNSGRNPLLRRLTQVVGRLAGFKNRARAFYFQVILSAYRCPRCEDRLEMTADNACRCSCGYSFDPTLAFQKSACCGSRLIKRTYHYACSKCHKVVPSKFLFDEKVFDREYFRDMMQESRRRAREKKEEVRRLLAGSRSDQLDLELTPDLRAIPGLVDELDAFINSNADSGVVVYELQGAEFHMNDYRDHILSLLGWNKVLFSDIRPLIADHRKDRVRRFITLIFMQNDGEVDLTQEGSDIWVRKIYYETYS